MASKEKIKDILDWVQSTMEVDWGFMACLKQDLENLVVIAQTEGVKEVKEALDKVYNNT
jgi:hypothetical protein